MNEIKEQAVRTVEVNGEVYVCFSDIAGLMGEQKRSVTDSDREMMKRTGRPAFA